MQGAEIIKVFFYSGVITTPSKRKEYPLRDIFHQWRTVSRRYLRLLAQRGVTHVKLN
jgi:hypothetical protein